MHPLKVYNSVIFSIFVKCNHHHNQFWKISHPPKEPPLSSVSPALQPQATTNLLCLHRCAYSGYSYKRTLFSVFCDWLLLYFQIYPYCTMYNMYILCTMYSLLLLNNIPFYGCTILYSFLSGWTFRLFPLFGYKKMPLSTVY